MSVSDIERNEWHREVNRMPETDDHPDVFREPEPEDREK